MKVIVKCEQCGNEIEISPVTKGNVAYFANDLLNHNFSISRTEIDVNDILEAKVSGLLTGTLKIKTKNGVVKYPIVQGKGAVKQILVKLGL